MKTITTLLLLLLASPVFAETYVCSYVNLNDQITTYTFSRTVNGFLRQAPSDDTNLDIIFESETVIVLHRTISSVDGEAVTEPFAVTHLFQIHKSDNKDFVQVFLSNTDSREWNFILEGTCTVVE